MLDEPAFRRAAGNALTSLKRHLILHEEEDEAGFEVEEQSGVLTVTFEKSGAKFAITPNEPLRQIWLSARSTSYQLDWDESAGSFLLPRTGERLEPLVDRLIQEQGTD